jgi:hypothetical protein
MMNIIEEFKNRVRLTLKWIQDKEYQKWLEDEANNVKRERILYKLPKILSGNAMVWCRNGSVCHMATPCSTLECSYKENKLDIISGVSKCQQFQITTKSSKWDNAEHICATCDVTPFVGW